MARLCCRVRTITWANVDLKPYKYVVSKPKNQYSLYTQQNKHKRGLL